MPGKRVLSVGQCGFDHGQLSHSLREMFGADVVAARGDTDALRCLGEKSFDLVLVNRVFDADGGSGMDFIRRLRAQSSVPVMLVSNYEDAQAEAVALGALSGFGKSALGSSGMKERLKDVLAQTSEPEA